MVRPFILLGRWQFHPRVYEQMTKPENDAELTQHILKAQRLAASLDKVTRERGILGVAWELANLTAAVREAEWRCRDIIRREL